jgi:hypothetical protein
MNKRSMTAITPKRRNSKEIQPELQADPWSRSYKGSPGRYFQKSGSLVSFSSHFSQKKYLQMTKPVMPMMFCTWESNAFKIPRNIRNNGFHFSNGCT